MKKLAKYIALVTLAASAPSVSMAQSGPYDDGTGYFYYCDAANCYTYWNTGTPEDPNWVLIITEPRVPGGRHEN